jgi:hypothetical protein
MKNSELEFLSGFIIVVYLLNFFHGKRENLKIANTWLNLVKPVFAENFGQIGTNKYVKSAGDVIFE